MSIAVWAPGRTKVFRAGGQRPDRLASALHRLSAAMAPFRVLSGEYRSAARDDAACVASKRNGHRCLVCLGQRRNCLAVGGVVGCRYDVVRVRLAGKKKRDSLEPR